MSGAQGHPGSGVNGAAREPLVLLFHALDSAVALPFDWKLREALRH